TLYVSLRRFFSERVWVCFFFFFQAEDGIRDLIVTEFRRVLFRSRALARQRSRTSARGDGRSPRARRASSTWVPTSPAAPVTRTRSEERRVGKECSARRGAGGPEGKRGE